MATLPIQAKKIAKEYVRNLRPYLKVKRALLFGSAARGKMSRHSDIDIIILSDEFKRMDLSARLVFLSRLRGRKFINWPMDILGYTSAEFKELTKVSEMFAEAEKEGIEIK